MTDLVGGSPDLVFDVNVTSNSNDINQGDNRVLLKQNLKTEADLEMVGGSIVSSNKFDQTYQVSSKTLLLH